ncbi:kinase suppressor of Ras 2, partial [Schistosoma haematobium]
LYLCSVKSSDSNSASSCTSSTPGSPFVTGTSSISTTLAASCCTRLDSGYVGVGSNSISVSCSTTGQMISLSSPPLRNLSNSGGFSIHSYGTVNAGIVTNTQQQQQPHSPRHSGQCFNHFEFPSVSHPIIDNQLVDGNFNNNVNNNSPLISTVSSGESERTVVDNAVHRFESMDSQDESSLMRTNSISVTLKEWDIPMENLFIGEIIGRGKFGTVYRGKWHGEVAIKRIDFDPEDVDDSIRVEAFKREVALLHKTRHENLVLFMGACMKAPDLAIVTQLSRESVLFLCLIVIKSDTSRLINHIMPGTFLPPFEMLHNNESIAVKWYFRTHVNDTYITSKVTNLIHRNGKISIYYENIPTEIEDRQLYTKIQHLDACSDTLESNNFC